MIINARSGKKVHMEDSNNAISRTLVKIAFPVIAICLLAVIFFVTHRAVCQYRADLPALPSLAVLTNLCTRIGTATIHAAHANPLAPWILAFLILAAATLGAYAKTRNIAHLKTGGFWLFLILAISMVRFHQALTLLFLSIAAFLFFDIEKRHPASIDRPSVGVSRFHWTALALIVLAGFVARFSQLDQIPPGYGAHQTDQIREINDAFLGWQSPEPLSFTFKFFKLYNHPLSGLITGAWMKIFGMNLISFITLSAWIGWLSIIVFYFVVFRLWQNRSLAILAALIMAVDPFHLTFSRYPSERIHIVTPLHAILLACFIFQALSKRSIPAFIGAGILLGIANALYESSYFTIPMIFAIIAFAACSKEFLDKRKTIGLIIMIAVFLIIAFPRLQNALNLHASNDASSTFALTYRGLSIVDPGRIASNLKSLAPTLLLKASDPWFERGHGALLPAPLLPFLFTGLFLAWKRQSLLQYKILLMWTTFGTICPIVSRELVPRRFILVMPAFYILIAAGFLLAWNSLPKTISDSLFLRRSVCLALAFCFVLLGMNLYFTDTKIGQCEHAGGRIMGEISSRLIPDYMIYLIPKFESDSAMIQFFCCEKSEEFPSVDGWFRILQDREDIALLPPPSAPARKGMAFCIRNEESREIWERRIKEVWPNATRYAGPGADRMDGVVYLAEMKR